MVGKTLDVPANCSLLGSGVNMPYMWGAMGGATFPLKTDLLFLGSVYQVRDRFSCFGCWSSYWDAGWVCNWHSRIKMVGCSPPGSRWSQNPRSQNPRWMKRQKKMGMHHHLFKTYLQTKQFFLPTLRTKCLGEEQMLELWHVGTLTLSDFNSFHIARRWVCFSVCFLCVCVCVCVCHDCLVHQDLSLWPNTC